MEWLYNGTNFSFSLVSILSLFYLDYFEKNKRKLHIWKVIGRNIPRITLTKVVFTKGTRDIGLPITKYILFLNSYGHLGSFLN